MQKNLCVQKDGSVFVDGKELDVPSWKRRSSTSTSASQNMPAREVFAEIGRASSIRHLVIGIIGPRDATEAQLSAADKIGNILGGLGLTLICGGKGGVMEAVSKGCSEAGGLMIGILPGSVPEDANQYVSVALPTGMGEARNMMIAKSARVLIAVGGSYGTLSEVAFGLHFSKPVIGIEGAADVEGVVHATSVDHAVQLALEALLTSAPMIGTDINV